MSTVLLYDNVLSFPLFLGGSLLFAVVGLMSILLILTLKSRVQEKSSYHKSLSEAKGRLEDTISSAPIAYLLSVDLFVVEINEVMHEKTGLSVGDDTRRIHADAEHLEAVVKRFEAGETVLNEVMKIRMANGEVHRVLLNIAAIEYNHQRAAMTWAIDIEERERRKDELHEVSDRLEQFIHNSPVAYLLDVDGCVVGLNERMRETTGLSIGSDVRDIYADISDRDVVIERLMRQGYLTNETVSFRLVDGEIHRCLINAILTEHEGRQAIAVWALDFEEYERREDALITSRREFREIKERQEWLIHTAPVGYMLIINGVITEINENLKALLDLKRGDIFKTSQTMLFNFTERIGFGQPVINELMEIVLPSGEPHRCLVSVASFSYKSQPATVIWTADIEETERQKDRLRVTQQGLQRVLDALPIPIRIADIEKYEIVYVNNSFLEMFGYGSADELYGQPLTKLVPFVQRDGVPSIHRKGRVMDAAEPVSTEIDYITADGRIIRSLLVSCMIDYNGRKSSIGIIRDLSREQREAELRTTAAAAQAASEAKSAFLANMSHELRTPMNAIVGFSELALYENTIFEKNDYLQKIIDSSDTLMGIINNILDISQIESGNIHMESIPFDLSVIIDSCRAMIEPQASAKDLSFFINADPPIGKRLLGDPVRLRQVLLHLLTNAVKFTDSGTVELAATIECVDAESISMRFEVNDSGIGMPPEQVRKIYEPFPQTDKSSRSGESGLGLAVAMNIIELMGGELMIESAPGKGSRFMFTIAFKTIEVRNTFESSAHRPVFQGSVLVCEDNLTNQEVIYEHLQRVGLDVVITKDGQECLDVVAGREKPFDLIFMDIHMPVMDGLETSKELARMGNKTPIVILTASIMPEDTETYRAHGMLYYLAKPFRTHELWDCLLKFLKPVNILPDNPSASAKPEAGFLRDHQSTLENITMAIDAGDMQLAHRLAHTLKSSAALIGKTKLASTALEVELSLKAGNKSPKRLSALRYELNAVLGSLAAALNITEVPPEPSQPLSPDEADALFEKLDSLLEVGDCDCLDLVDELRRVPGTEDLICELDEYDFEPARRTLERLRRSLR